MSMIDDIVAVSECSDKSIETNAVINKFVESKKLEFGKKNATSSISEKIKIKTVEN